MSKAEEQRMQCRDRGDSYHVQYTVNQDDIETENLTHATVIDQRVIDEREDNECGWVAQFENEDAELVQLLVSTDEEMGWDVEQRLTGATCLQLSDMFLRVGERALQRASQRAAKDEAERRRIAELDARQGELPLDVQEAESGYAA